MAARRRRLHGLLHDDFLARELNRSPVYLRGLQTRFVLPVLEGAPYANSYLAFLRTIVFLRTFGVRFVWRCAYEVARTLSFRRERR
jgi:hypothetical protein